jgi:hypothetical protein
VETISITLTGTTNSLHIEKYVISYGNRPSHSVTLMCGDEVFATLHEETGGQGVIIPMAPEVEGWWCVGWSKTGCDQVDVANLVKSNNTFYPSEDCTLWANYE